MKSEQTKQRLALDAVRRHIVGSYLFDSNDPRIADSRLLATIQRMTDLELLAVEWLGPIGVAYLRTIAPYDPTSENENDGKNPNAVALGRKGGLKGGKARANALSPERRREIAQAAVTARWARVKETAA